MLGKGKKKTSSNRPFLNNSAGIFSILFAVAVTKTGDVFSPSQVKKVARTRFVVPLSPLFLVLAKALSNSSIHKIHGERASAVCITARIRDSD